MNYAPLLKFSRVMDGAISRTDPQGLQPHLQRSEVLSAVVVQLRKDLALAEDQLSEPPVDEDPFLRLSAAIMPHLEAHYRHSVAALQGAMYRVDIPEAHFRRTMQAGGLEALAGEVVIRALQKVLTRMRFSGRF